VLKLDCYRPDGEYEYREIDSGRVSTDYFFETRGLTGMYEFVVQGCAKALDGSTNYCSPESPRVSAVAPDSFRSLKSFLMRNGLGSLAATGRPSARAAMRF